MRGQKAPTRSLGHPSTHSKKTCRMPAYRDKSPSPKSLSSVHLLAQDPQPAAVEERLTHPKCCTTLGNMAASWSMDGYWYLWHREAQDGGYGTCSEQGVWDRADGLPEMGREMSPTCKPPYFPPLVWTGFGTVWKDPQAGPNCQAATTQGAGR